MKNSYTVKEDGFQAYWFEGTTNREKVIIWMHGSGMNEKHCLKDSEYLREKGYSVLVLGFYFWKGMSKKMRGIPVDYIEKAVSELKKNGFEKIGIHGISSGAAYALLCASLIPDISLVLSISFNEEAGFKTKFYEADNKRLRVDVFQCPYDKYCTLLGCKELTATFCYSDDCIYGNLTGIEYQRNVTIGRGADKCDFNFRKA